MAKIDEFGNYVYPKVPRKYWKAVVMACGIIRDHQTFNVAIERASSRFNVNPVELRKHVVARTQAGCEHSRMQKRIFPEPKLPRMLKVPHGYCMDCEYCRVDGVCFSEIVDKHRQLLKEYEEKEPIIRAELLERIEAILSDDDIPKNKKGMNIAKLLGSGRRRNKSWTAMTTDEIVEEIDRKISSDKPYVPRVNPVCTRHSQVRIVFRREPRLAFPEIEIDKVIEGKVGCGEFEAHSRGS